MPYIGRGLTTGAQYQKLDAIAINNATTFTMSVGSSNVSPDQNHLILVVNGVIQEPGTGFTVSGSTCTLASAITTSGHSGLDTIYGVIAGDAAFAAYDSIGANALGVTAGTVTASRAIVPDGNKDIASFRNVTLTGELDAATLDISGNADIDGTTNLDAVDIDGAVQIDSTVTVGVNDTGYDVKFFGATASAYMLWDASADDLVLAGAAGIDLAGDIDVDGTATFAGVIRGANGSAAAPEFSFTNNTDSGMYSPADNQLALASGGTQALIFGGDQSATFASAVQGTSFIANSATPSILMTETDTDPDSECRLVNGGGNLYIDGDLNDEIADSFMAFRLDNGSEKMRITSAGNVGIGTASPGSLLTVQGDNKGIDIRSADYSNVLIASAGSSGAGLDRGLIVLRENGSNKTLLYGDGSATFGGKVGIGDDSPSYKLDVKNNIDSWVQRITNTHANAYGLWIDHNASTSDNNDRKFLMCEDASEAKCIIWSDGDVNNDDGAYGTISDVRIKQGIRDANSQWDDIKAMKIRNFKKNHDVIQYGDKAWEQIGVVAQELEEAGMDKLVREHPAFESEISNNEDINEGDMVKSVQSSIIYMKAVKCLQEAIAKIETLEAKVEALENG